ncbi:AraC family transcriptional regulator [Aureivirga marina]|uniref:AraC family transcriptional regulator n=1 Tax=Aureivirga marina TaxID=1182451 RepID=UPI0018CA3096|nr:helix-turn-helix domain-containing protein [Aureivirga marina]
MKKIKVYKKVDILDEKKNFEISEMASSYENRKGKMNEPHRHDFYTVLFIEKGKGEHIIDFQSYKIQDFQIFFVSPGQVHQVLESEKSEGFVLTFSTEFLIQNSIPISFIEDLNLFQNYGESPPLNFEKETFWKLKKYLKEINHLFHSSTNLKEISIGAFLKIILIECYNYCAINFDKKEENHLVSEFKKEVNLHYKKEHSTSFYAEKLVISADYLNRIIKYSIGKTAKEYIQTRILTEAKRLLYFSTNSTKEIGFELGFKEPSNFSAFFKKYSGISPSNFRKKEKQQ